MTIQALIPPALAALHNFIWQYDPEEIRVYDNEVFDPQIGYQESAGELGTGLVTDEMLRANERRDRMAGEMWEQYQDYLQSHRVVITPSLPSCLSPVATEMNPFQTMSSFIYSLSVDCFPVQIIAHRQ